MKKPIWLRLMGFGVWAFLALWAGMFLVKPTPQTAMGQLVAIGLFPAAAFVLFLLWAIISGIVWAANRNARMQAAVMRDVFGDLTKALRSQPVQQPAENQVWDNPPTRIVCDSCKRPHAMLHCIHHTLSLCFPCTAKHDSQDCTYIAAGRWAQKQVGEKEIRRTTVTSPLSGIR